MEMIKTLDLKDMVIAGSLFRMKRIARKIEDLFSVNIAQIGEFDCLHQAWEMDAIKISKMNKYDPTSESEVMGGFYREFK